jgi:general secretion pathway protein E
MAQRLVRVLCPECKARTCSASSEAELLGGADCRGRSVFRPVGCEHCNHSGYRGRMGIYELIEVDATSSGP